MEIFFKNTHPWRMRKGTASAIIHTAGEISDNAISRITAILESKQPPQDELANTLLQIKSHFALIIKTKSKCFAAVDTIRSHPVFYAPTLNAVSNTPRNLKKHLGVFEVNKTAALDIFHSGYPWDGATIDKNIHQLQPGEFLLKTKTHPPSITSYYSYLPTEPSSKPRCGQLISDLEDILNTVFSRLMDQLNGREAWISLSGGFDSRLILFKLHELGYKKIKTFSYGPAGNRQARIAKATANALDTPWLFIPPPSPRNARSFFKSNTRRSYWEFSDALSSTPFMQDFYPIFFLQQKHILPEDSLIINGQSGDFLSGSHIPEAPLRAKTKDSISSLILKKYMSLWELGEQAKKERLSFILRSFDSWDNLSIEARAAIYELLEWRNRQSKFVVNGQRCYDFFGYAWKLPLWDIDYMDFWKNVPFEYRKEQSLLKKYLIESYDYKGLFSKTYGKTPTYMGKMGWPIGKMVDALDALGLPSLKYSAKYSHYGDYYRQYSMKQYLKLIKHATVPPFGRGIVAFNTWIWFKENNFPIPDATLAELEF